MHRINHYSVVSVNKTNHAFHWIVTYSVYSVVHLSNNPGQEVKLMSRGESADVV